MPTLLKIYRYSFIAGAFSAGGSFFGRAPSQLSKFPVAATCYSELLLLRIVPILLMMICNVLNWRYYLKALQYAPQTLTVTVLTAASNYMLSFILGALVYREEITLLSVVGAIFIIIGLWYLGEAHQEHSNAERKKQRQKYKELLKRTK